MDERLDSNSAIPLYQQLMEKVEAKIISGEYRPGDKLRPEVELAKQYGVSVITARKSMDELARRGLVERKQGKGTFVAQPKYGRDYTQIQSFSDSCLSRGLIPGALLIRRELVTPRESVRKSLELSDRAQVVEIVRLRYVNGEPMVIETNYFSLDYAFLLQGDLSGSLFHILQEERNVSVKKSKKIVEICRATSEEAHHLKLRKGAPLLLVSSVAYTGEETPVYVCKQVINGERFQLIL